MSAGNGGPARFVAGMGDSGSATRNSWLIGWLGSLPTDLSPKVCAYVITVTILDVSIHTISFLVPGLTI